MRDIVADGKRVWDGEKGSWIKLGASIIGAVPVGGDVAKPIIKEVGEELTEKGFKEIGGETVEKLGKEEAEKLAKEQAEQIAKQIDEFSINGHGPQRHGSVVLKP